MKSKLRIILFSFLFLLQGLVIQAQFSQPFLRKIGKNEGLTGSLVLSMLQDQRNIYWIGTINGLQQFDGKEFKKMPVPTFQKGIYGSNSISHLLITDDSTLWISNYQGIAKFNTYTHQYELIKVPKESATQSIAFTSLFKGINSTIYASSFELGLIKYNTKLNQFEKLNATDLNELKRLKVQATKNENELLLLHKNGLDLFNINKNRITEKSALPSEYKWLNDKCFSGEIFDLLKDDKTTYSLIWNHKKVKYDLLIYDKSNDVCKTVDLNSVAGRKFFKDSNNNIWIYGDGIDVIPSGSMELVSIKENIKEGRLIDFTMCHRMYEDNEHNIWFCTNAGLFVFNINEKNFKICNEKDQNGYVKHMYNSICELKDQNIWVGTFGEGLLIVDKDINLNQKIDFEAKTHDKLYNMIWNIYESKLNNEIWLGCQKGRLIRYDQTTKKFNYYNDSVFEEKTIMYISEDEGGNMYFGTNGGAVISKRKNEPSFTIYYKSEAQGTRTAAGEIKQIINVGKELIIATQNDGIICINKADKKIKKHTMNLDHPLGLRSNNIFCLLKKDSLNYYVGSSNGLGLYDRSKNGFEFYTMYDGLPFSNIYDLMDVGNGLLLASTSDGLYKINWELKSFERVEKNATLYKGFNFISHIKNKNSLLLADDEYLYLLPIQNDQKKKLPTSYIFSINSFDKTYFIDNKSGTLSFDKDHNTINVNFGTSSFNFYNSIDYYYKIEGVDKNWVYAGNNRTITYNDLKGGTYTLQLKCVFQEDKKQEQLLKIHFEIEKPFNQSIWFYVLIAGIAVGFFYLFYRIRLNKLLAIEKIRFDLSKDLHDDMGSTLSTINILSVMAENKLEHDLGTSKQYLKRINQISQEMMQNMDDIVWSINPNNDSMGKVVVRMREFAAEILEPLDINLHFDTDNAIQELGTKMRWRRDFYLIFKEAINNSAKYSECKNVHIAIRIINRKLQLEIIDDGKGFNILHSKMGNGLTNMKNRAKNIGGEIHIQSQQNQGTHIQLFIPLNKI
ncbi:MAG: hypothetical protein J0L87_00135 [Bacteroidetes bacterium]|nr:hypothetical protein [Bacteroidota bacterium]